MTSSRARPIARQRHEELPQLVHRHVRRVDDLVGQVADRVQPRPLVADALADRSVRRQRMRPPRLAEAPHERGVARLEEDQHRIEPRHLPQPLEDLRERRQEVALAHVDDDGDLADVAAGAERQLRERRDQRRRQVVDAEVAEILERADRLRLAGARQAGEDDERMARASRRLHARRLPARARRRRPRRRPRASGIGILRRCRRPSRGAASARGARRARARRGGRARAAAGCAPRPRPGSRCCGRARPASGSAARAARESRGSRRRARAARTRAPDPSARAARPARRAWTTASTRCRTDP